MALESGNASQSLLRNVYCTKEIAYNFHLLYRDIHKLFYNNTFKPKVKSCLNHIFLIGF